MPSFSPTLRGVPDAKRTATHLMSHATHFVPHCSLHASQPTFPAFTVLSARGGNQQVQGARHQAPSHAGGGGRRRSGHRVRCRPCPGRGGGGQSRSRRGGGGGGGGCTAAGAARAPSIPPVSTGETTPITRQTSERRKQGGQAQVARALPFEHALNSHVEAFVLFRVFGIRVRALVLLLLLLLYLLLLLSLPPPLMFFFCCSNATADILPTVRLPGPWAEAKMACHSTQRTRATTAQRPSGPSRRSR